MITSKNTILGFIGTGVMGQSMAGHLLAAGYKLNVYTRSPAKAAGLLTKGARWCESVAELSADSDVIFTMVGFPEDVREIYFGAKGIIENMKPGTVLIDLTTSSPELAKQISEAALTHRGAALDAPVSGGDIGAREARLSIMVGGEAEIFQQVLPLFKLMGSNIVYQGRAGAGQHCKMCNQIAIASTMMGVCESIAYARKAGLDPETVLKSIATGAAGSWSLSHLAPKMIDGDFAPGFYIKHFIKDMTLALESAEAMTLKTPGLDLAKTLYKSLAAKGFENLGTQALFKHYDFPQ
ncbi:NAD(P)-dependent oxidoreductase [Kiritimatiellaeota bacterium B1221]|nr:NAD(P)-dependent oxidoreductase [Kiritimatiellaeota bacterium B1221]